MFYSDSLSVQSFALLVGDELTFIHVPIAQGLLRLIPEAQHCMYGLVQDVYSVYMVMHVSKWSSYYLRWTA